MMIIEFAQVQVSYNCMLISMTCIIRCNPGQMNSTEFVREFVQIYQPCTSFPLKAFVYKVTREIVKGSKLLLNRSYLNLPASSLFISLCLQSLAQLALTRSPLPC